MSSDANLISYFLDLSIILVLKYLENSMKLDSKKLVQDLSLELSDTLNNDMDTEKPEVLSFPSEANFNQTLLNIKD